MPEQLWFTQLLNHLFAGPVTVLMRALHFPPPQYPQAPISNPVAMEVLVFGFLLVLFSLAISAMVAQCAAARWKKSSRIPSVRSLKSFNNSATTGRRRSSSASLVARNCAT